MHCRLCGSPGGRVFELRGRSYADCPACGFIALSPGSFLEPEAEKARYLLHRNDPADPGYRSFLLAFIAALPGLSPASRILDFGSGPEPALATLLREGGALPSIYDPYFAPGSSWRRKRFDFILLHEVAEHLAYPRRTLEALARRLLPGGILALRTRFAPESTTEFAKWWYREDPTHRGFFREGSLRALSGFLGLELLRLSSPDLALYRRSLSSARIEACRAPASSPASRPDPGP